MSTETAEAPALPQELAVSERADPSTVHPAAQIFRFMYHLVSAAREPKDLLRFEYLSRLSGSLMDGDIIFCEPADRTWWAVIRVLEVCGEGVVVEPIVSKETLRYQPPPPKRGPLGTNADEFEIQKSEKFTGKWAVVRIDPNGEKHVMTAGSPFSKAQCEEWLKRHLVTVRTT